MKKNDIGRTVVYVSRRDLREIQSLLHTTGTSFSEWVRAQMRGLIGERRHAKNVDRFIANTESANQLLNDRAKRKGKA